MALSVAILDNSIDTVYELIFNDCDVNQPNDVGNRPLHAAAFTGNVKIAEILLKAGASINTTNEAGRTALMIAALNNNKDMVKYLLGNGADAKLKDKTGVTARDLARDGCAEPLDRWLDEVVSSLLSFQTDSTESLPVAAPNIRGMQKDPAENLLTALSFVKTVNGTDTSLLQKQDSQNPVEVNSTTRKKLISPRNSSEFVLQPSPRSGKTWNEMEEKRGVPFIPHGGGDLKASEFPKQTSPEKVDLEPRGDKLIPSLENVHGFYVEVDGAKIFVPQVKIINNKKKERREKFRAIRVEILFTKENDELGILLKDDADGIRVERVKPKLASVVKAGDLILNVNGVDCRNLSLEAIVAILTDDKVTKVQLEVERITPTVCEKKIDWNNAEDMEYIRDIIEVLSDPPDSLDATRLLHLIHEFQHVVDLCRKNENEALLDLLVKGLACTEDNYVDLAASLVHRSFRFINDVDVVEDTSEDEHSEEQKSVIKEVYEQVINEFLN